MSSLELSRQMLERNPKVIVVSLAGEVDVGNTLQADQYFDRMLQEDQPRHVLLDLRGLTFAGSAFFSSLLFWREELTRRQGRLVVFGLRPEITGTLRILGLDRALPLHRDQPSALGALSGKE